MVDAADLKSAFRPPPGVVELCRTAPQLGNSGFCPPGRCRVAWGGTANGTAAFPVGEPSIFSFRRGLSSGLNLGLGGSAMHITGLGVAGFGLFGDPLSPDDHDYRGSVEGYFSLRCDERVNLLVGPNGGGKSTLLWAVRYLYALEGSLFYLVRDPCMGWLDFSDDWPLEVSDNDDPWWRPLPGGSVPLVYLPSTRVTLPPRRFSGDAPLDRDDLRVRWNLPWLRILGPEFDEVAFPPLPLGGLFETADGIFSGRDVEEAVSHLALYFRDSRLPFVDNRHGSSSQGSVMDLSSDSLVQGLLGAVNAGYSCAREICSEIIGGDAPHPYTDRVDVLHRGYPDGDDFVSSEELVLPSMGVVTRDDLFGGQLYVGDLSSGTQSTLLWVWALALEMAYHYAFQESWQEQPAILLIDEIENHLHPAWQRRVIPVLLERFPRLQVFATTHSPFVVAGLKAGQVHRLSRSYGSGSHTAVSVETNQEDIVGWTADEICREYLDITDPTDWATAQAAAELRRLRLEGEREDPALEAERQERMLELRGMVDRDLLEGGPTEADRRLFEAEFAATVRRLWETGELN